MEDGGSEETLATKPALVKDISEERRKRKAARDAPAEDEKTARLRPGRVHQALMEAVSRTGPNNLPPFPVRYHVYAADDGTRLLVREGERDEVRPASFAPLVTDLLAYCAGELGTLDDFQLTHRQATEAAAYFLAAAPLIPRPAAVSWQGEDGRTFRRLPWTRQRGDTPTWDAVLSRLSNAQGFRLWLGSLFDPGSSLQQYVWIHGEGSDGKGAINRFLALVFGAAYASKQPPPPGDKFWTHGLIGKRLVAFPDCNSQAFVTSGLFKSMTGGDPIHVEAKGQMPFTYQPDTKYLFLSNTKPTVTAERADQRRIIYCEFEPRETEDDPEFEAKLWEQGGAFLTACIEDYRAACPRHGHIATDHERLADWVEALEDRHAEVLDTHFRIDHDDRENWVTGVELQRILGKVMRTPRDLQTWVSWLKTRHGILRKTCRDAQGTSKRYAGLVSTSTLDALINPSVHKGAGAVHSRTHDEW